MKKIFLIFLLSNFITPSIAQDAKDIVMKADQKMRGESSIVEITMKIIKPEWDREISIKTWNKGTKLALILLTAPARDKGAVFLKRDKEVWNWLPSIERVVKIPPSMMMQSWMGSDFTNDDLVKQSSIIVDYEHEIVGDSTIAGKECYKILFTPKPDAPVVWGKIYSWIAKDDPMQLRVEYYDEDGYLVNILQMSDIKEMDGREIPTRMEMIPVEKEGNKTIMIYKSISFNEKIEESFFSQQNMKRIR
ncbi:MAG: outer membrane lipoprotein-sorting protein [Bacteroidia bacterium]|nr:outer membrane lipoprotein-sorting protein [Bacteroidia bacterium]